MTDYAGGRGQSIPGRIPDRHRQLQPEPKTHRQASKILANSVLTADLDEGFDFDENCLGLSTVISVIHESE